eukprot:848366-Pelagomonas_calceolata.AAC.3
MKTHQPCSGWMYCPSSKAPHLTRPHVPVVPRHGHLGYGQEGPAKGDERPADAQHLPAVHPVVHAEANAHGGLLHAQNEQAVAACFHLKSNELAQANAMALAIIIDRCKCAPLSSRPQSHGPRHLAAASIQMWWALPLGSPHRRPDRLRIAAC